MKIIIKIILLLYMSSSMAEEYSTLYGLSLGDPLSTVSAKLGAHDQVIDLEGGAKVLVFMAPDHYAAIVTVPPKHDFIYSIQVTGEKSQGEQSIEGVVLGDEFSKVVDKFGDPTESRNAIDQQTNEEIKDTKIHLYGENFSFEVVGGKVTSIKLTYDGTLSSDNPADDKLMAEQPVEIQKVQKFILNEGYPEVFKEQRYRVSIENIQVIDLDFDGLNEVVVQYAPHYAQSPTIVIYQISKDGVVTRVNEGLAPGPLVKRGDYYLDSHANGEGVDFTLGKKPLSAEKRKEVAKSVVAKSKFGMIVQYENFFHADNRQAEKSYIDMSHVAPFSDELKCAGFEFAKIDSLLVGHVESKDNGQQVGFIAAAIGEETYFYKIFGIDDGGFLNKELTVIDTTK